MEKKRKSQKNLKKHLTSRGNESIVPDIKGKDASEDISDRFCLSFFNIEKGV